MVRLDDTGKLLVRTVPAVLMLLHGVHKLGHGIGGVVDIMTHAGLPGFLAYGVYVGEVVAPLLLIVGFWSRIGGWLIAVNMLFALWLAHWSQLTLLNPQSGGLQLEAQYLFLAAAVALALIGPGRYAIHDR